MAHSCYRLPAATDVLLEVGDLNVSAVSALALSQFIPLHLKVQEVHRIEHFKVTGVFDGLPDDVTMDKRLPPQRQLHPSNESPSLHA